MFIYLSLKKSVYNPELVAKLLSEKLDKHGVLTQIALQSDSESEDMKAVITNAANTYKPDQILTVLTTEDNSLRVIGGLGPGGLKAGALPYVLEKHITELDITVHDVALRKNIWRALIYGTSKPLENSLTDIFIQKLEVDGLLPENTTTNKMP